MKTISKLLYALKNKNIFFYYQKQSISFGNYLKFQLKTNQNSKQKIICIELNPKYYWLYYNDINNAFSRHSNIPTKTIKDFLLYWNNICK